MSYRNFAKLEEGDGYAMAEEEARVAFRHIRREHHQLYAEVTVDCQWSGVQAFSGTKIISCADLNLSSQRERTSRASYCEERSHTGPLEKDGKARFDWKGLFDEACATVIAAEREGDPMVALEDVADADEDEYNVHGVVLPRRDNAALVADGGKGKSTLALYVAGELEQLGERVVLCDYETDGAIQKRRAQAMFGAVPHGLFYRKCIGPFVREVNAIRRDVRRHGITYGILDSAVPACDAEAEASVTASALNRAQREVGIGWLTICHTAKNSERGKEKPFGSTFWWNLARSVWVLESHATSDRLVLAVHHRKCNNGPLRSAVGFEFLYGQNRIDAKPCRVVDTEELAEGLPIWQRVQLAVTRQGPLKRHELMELTGASDETIGRELRRHRDLFRLVHGSDGVQRIGLVPQSGH